MTRKNATWLAVAASVVLSACGAEDTNQPTVAENADSIAQTNGIQAKAGSPFEISYEIIGHPIVGSPVTLNLHVTSAFGPSPVEISYIITDATALMLHEAQPESLRAEMTMNETFVEDRVTVIPQREGRVYLNVEAAVATEEGRSSTTMAVPINVDAADTSPVEDDEETEESASE